MCANSWNARDYQQHAAFVPRLASEVLELLDPKPQERILDLGCGDGSLSLQIAQSGCTLECIDASPDMVASARAKGLNANLQDGQRLDATNCYDAVFSNAALHWMPEADQVLQRVFRALKPGGRLVGEFGGHGNIDAVVQAMQATFDSHPDFGVFENPWFFPTARHYRALLSEHGFRVQSCRLHRRPTSIDGAMKDWLQVFTAGITQHLTPAQSNIFYQAMESRLASRIDSNSGKLTLDYMRLRFQAFKPKAG